MNSSIRYWFDDVGGFVVVDDVARIGAYAYPTSDNAKEAKSAPIQTAETMLNASAPFIASLGIACPLYPHLANKAKR